MAGKVKKRQVTAAPTKEEGAKPGAAKKKKKAVKGGKTLLSFEGDEGDEEIPVRPAKPKFNPKLVTDAQLPAADETSQRPESQTRKRPRSPSPKRSAPEEKQEQQTKKPDPATQIPLPNPESPERSPAPESPPAKASKLDRTKAEIENLKFSMRRTATTGPVDAGPKKSALEAMIPETSIRGRKRPPPGASSSGTNGIAGFSSAAEDETLKIFNAFKAKLENADSTIKPQPKRSSESDNKHHKTEAEAEPEDEEAQLCDLHFIANCQSCQSWDNPEVTGDKDTTEADEGEEGWLTHQLRFGKDTLGKDAKWKREHPDDVDSLMVIDPRAREKEIVGGKGKKKGMARDRERDRKKERVGDLEWGRGR